MICIPNTNLKLLKLFFSPCKDQPNLTTKVTVTPFAHM